MNTVTPKCTNDTCQFRHSCARFTTEPPMQIFVPTKFSCKMYVKTT